MSARRAKYFTFLILLFLIALSPSPVQFSINYELKMINQIKCVIVVGVRLVLVALDENELAIYFADDLSAPPIRSRFEDGRNLP